jgi:hypothetical protein
VAKQTGEAMRVGEVYETSQLKSKCVVVRIDKEKGRVLFRKLNKNSVFYLPIRHVKNFKKITRKDL